MSKEIQKLGYCFTCDENVPHRREKAKGWQQVFCNLLQKLQLRRWYCLQCQSSRYFLPFVGEAAVEYWVDEPSDLADPFDDDFSIPLIENGGQQPTHGAGHRTLFIESRDMLQKDPLDFRQEDILHQEPDDDFFFEEKENGSVLTVPQDTNGSNSIAADISLVVDEADGVSVESRQSASNRASKIVVAEPVGNFIKEQSLVVETTRLKRFTEKYRDAVVDRILSGNTQIKWLIADGKYTEAELLSWIADKAKRESTDENQTIELDSAPRRRNKS